jgi:hypothetical protein
MKHRLSIPAAGLALALGAAGSACAGGTTLTVRATTDRQPGDFALPKDTSYEFAVAHAFDGGLIVGGSTTYTDPAFEGTSTTNVEGTVGYRARFSSVFSATATAGVGEHFQSPEEGVDFPYYLLKVTAAIELGKRVTWTAVSFRYRNAFDPANDYDTPQLATEIAYRLDKHNTVSAKLAGNWSNGAYASTGLSVAYTLGF